MYLKKMADRMYGKFTKEETPRGDIYFSKFRVYPFLNPDGKINWKNLFGLGNPKKLIFPLLFLAIISLAIYEYYTNFSTCRVAVEFYNVAHNLSGRAVEAFEINLTNLTWTP